MKNLACLGNKPFILHDDAGYGMRLAAILFPLASVLALLRHQQLVEHECREGGNYDCADVPGRQFKGVVEKNPQIRKRKRGYAQIPL